MKKNIISIMLTLFMVFNIFTVSVFAVESVASYENNINYAMTLKAFNVINEVDVTLDWINQPISRAQFISMLVRLVGYDDNISFETKLPYDDIYIGYEYFKEICYAYSFGIIDDSMLKFKPEEPTDLTFAAKTALCALGYSELIKQRNGIYSDLQAYKKLLRHVNKADDFSLNCAYSMCYNMLTAPMANVSSFSSDIMHFDTDDTIASKYFDAELIRGRFMASQFASLNGKNTVKGMVEIDDVQYKANNSFLNLFGHEVCGFVKNVNEYKQIIYIYADDHDDDYIEISGRDFEGFDSDKIVYYDNNKTRIVRLNNPIIVYNGETVSGSDYAKDLFEISDGSITIFMKSNVGFLINIVSYKNMIIGSIDLDEKTVYADNLEGVSLKIEYEDNNYFVSLKDDKDAEVKLSQLKSGSLITYAASISNNVVDAYISSNIIESSVDSIVNSTDGVISEIECEDKLYHVSEEALKGKPLLRVSDAYRLYVNKFGTIGAFELLETKGQIFCYLMGIQFKEFSNETYINVLPKDAYDSDDNVVYKLSDKVMIDGTRYRSKGAPAALSLYDSSGEFPIIVKLNSKSEVSYIDTPFYDSTKEQEESLICVHKADVSNSDDKMHSKEWYYLSNGISNSLNLKYYQLTSGMIILKIADELYPSQYLRNDTNYFVDLYSVGTDTPFVTFTVVHDSTNIAPTYESGVYIVESISYTSDTDDEIVCKVSLLDKDINNVTYNSDVDKSTGVGDLKKGDMVRIALDVKNNISSVEVICKYENFKTSVGYKSSTLINAERRYVIGVVDKISREASLSKAFITYFFDEGDRQGTSESCWFSENTYLLEVVRNRLVVSKINEDNIRTYENYGGDADVIFASYSYGNAGLKIIIR